MLLRKQHLLDDVSDHSSWKHFEPDVDYLKLLLLSRETDLREGLLFRQGKGYLCVPCAGHENMAAVAQALRKDDYIYCHYRDRALLLARGASLQSLALNYFAKKDSSSAGKQMAGHYSAPDVNIMSCPSPIGSQCIPAAGTAWAFKMDGTSRVVACCMGEAGVRQGEFYEAFAFAVQEKLPVIFVIEDNGYGISTPTERLNPFHLNVLDEKYLTRADGRIPEQVYFAMEHAANEARQGKGPRVVWLSFDRLLSHTSSDDQRLYRHAEELRVGAERDPILYLRDRLYAEGKLSEAEWERVNEEVKEDVRKVYLEAASAPEPELTDLMGHIYAPSLKRLRTPGFIQERSRITYAAALNETLRHLLATDPRVLMFGQDIEDPKGGVFGLTKGLSSQFSGRVTNAPLAEATICGTAVGLALAGRLPIFEIQFIDFVATGFNQIVNQMATMRWRTSGQLKCPLILLAPCGGYVQGGGPWHTQTNESLFAHVPGLHIYMPSTAMDVADVVLNCAAGEDPSLVLLPKHLFFKEFDTSPVSTLKYERAQIMCEGEDVTIVAWGNCVHLAQQAAQALSEVEISAEVIDLKAIVPCDRHTLHASLSKTGRIVVVHEDNKTCSFGQALVSEIVTNPDTWKTLYSSPRHVCREDVLVPFHPALARLALPTVEKIVAAAISTMS